MSPYNPHRKYICNSGMCLNMNCATKFECCRDCKLKKECKDKCNDHPQLCNKSRVLDNVIP
jgi:hypothetical protein